MPNARGHRRRAKRERPVERVVSAQFLEQCVASMPYPDNAALHLSVSSAVATAKIDSQLFFATDARCFYSADVAQGPE